MNKPLILEYNIPAPENADFVRSFDNKNDSKYENGWEKWSMPLGNSHFGASIFGRTDRDRIQITENSLSNPIARDRSWSLGYGGTRSFGDLIFDFGHEKPQNYYRYLSLDDAVAGVTYTFAGVDFKKEYFLSYPDNVLAMRFSANKGSRISFSVYPLISFCRSYCISVGDGMGRSGEISSDRSDIIMRGVSDYYDIKYEGRARVKAYGGKITNENGKITVKNADSAEVYFTCGTNYKMERRVFDESDPKKKLEPYPAPDEKVLQNLNKAFAKGYSALKAAHIADYRNLFARVSFSVGGKRSNLTTNELLEQYKKYAATPIHDVDIIYDMRYTEELVFQYGRYLMIASSRKGGYPANLQGTWCAYDSSPWGSAYNHNMNVQMNYWPVETANLTECFEPYNAYVDCYMTSARKNADAYVLQNYPDRYENKDSNGWTVGDISTLYSVSAPRVGGPAGPGAGVFTSLLLWQHYDFTRNRTYLRETVFPALLEMSRFLTKTLVEKNGKFLVRLSASPSQTKDGGFYVTTGCAFDQQLVYENFDKTLQAARILGITENDEPLLKTIEDILPLLDPVIISTHGHIKEYREEKYYGHIGEKDHNRVSQLVGLYPGDMINKKTTEWLDGARKTLEIRGDGETGEAMAHRMCLWTRIGDSDKALESYGNFIKNRAFPNLLSANPPFQIAGNFGVTAGVCEMLMQSHMGIIEILPVIPDEWRNGSFIGLCARGNFTVGCVWENKIPRSLSVSSGSGGVCRLKFKGAERAYIDNKEFSVDGDYMYFPMVKDETVHIATK